MGGQTLITGSDGTQGNCEPHSEASMGRPFGTHSILGLVEMSFLLLKDVHRCGGDPQ